MGEASVHPGGEGAAGFVAVGVCGRDASPIWVDQEAESNWIQELG